MAEMDDRINPDNYLGVIRAALDPDERKFFKEYLGQDSPGVMDYLAPQGRFGKARDLRESIVKGVLEQALQPRATVGEAQALFPDMPVPPNAMRTTQIPLQGPGQPQEIPIARLASETDQDYANTLDYMQSSAPYRQRGGAFFEEGPQPTASVTGVDPNALLPRSFQNVVNAKTQAMVNPRHAGAGITDAMVKLQTRERLGKLRSGAMEMYPGETRDIEQELGFYDKAPMPGTPGARKESAEAAIAEAKAPYAGVREQSALATDAAQRTASAASAGLSDAHTVETNLLMHAKLAKLLADTKLAETQAGQTGQRADNAESRLRLLEAGKLLDMTKTMEALNQLSPSGVQEMYKHIAGRIAPDLGLVGDEPNAFQKLFGLQPTKMTVKPQGGPVTAPDVTPPQGAVTSQTETPATPQAPPSWAKGMKDGESRKSPDGKTYRRKGNRLEQVP